MRVWTRTAAVAWWTALALAPLRAQGVRLAVPAWVESENAAAPLTFEATLNGKAVPVVRQLGPDSDQVILIVMDVTGDLSYIDPARQALADSIGKLPANTWVALLRAQDGLRVLADPGADRNPVLEAIQSLPNSGTPGLLETVTPALALADALGHASAVRLAVLYITDSNLASYRDDYTNPVINQSDPHDLSRKFPEALIGEKISRLIDETAALEAPLFVVHLHDRPDRLNRAYENGLETLASATGGRTSNCRSVAEIPEAISGAFERISQAWSITLALPAGSHKGGQIRLRVRSGNDDLRLAWRTRAQTKGADGHGERTRSNRNRSGI
jgi:hypothetical protein